jgi:hypothetical protein
MAAAAARDAGDVGAELAPLELIADIVRKTCAKYGWNKSDSTFKTFQKHIKDFASTIELTLEDMATSSEAHAKDIVYSSIAPFNWKKNPQLMERFQNIPYIIYVGDDNITNVVIRKGNVDCPIKEITPDMIQLLKYLGIVRVFVDGDLAIPQWTDNIVHLQIYSMKVMQCLEDTQIPFPKYLQVMIDETYFVGKYTNWLPSNLITLESACTELENLPASLQNYTYTGIHTNAALVKAEYLPIGIKKVIYFTQLTYSTTLSISEITMPPGTQYLELWLERIKSNILIFKNVKKLYITMFADMVSRYGITKEELIGSNLTSECEIPCGCCGSLRQNVEIILEEGLEHLVVDLLRTFNHSVHFLKCIKQVPSSLQHLTIYINKKFIKKYGTSIDFIRIERALLDKDKNDDELIIIIQDFILKFPHIKVSIEPEPKREK